MTGIKYFIILLKTRLSLFYIQFINLVGLQLFNFDGNGKVFISQHFTFRWRQVWRLIITAMAKSSWSLWSSSQRIQQNQDVAEAFMIRYRMLEANTLIAFRTNSWGISEGINFPGLNIPGSYCGLLF